MSHKVRLSWEAEQNVAAICDYIAQDSPANARRWRSAFANRLRSLQNFPDRHEIAYCAKDVGRDVRHTFFGVYRVLYTVESSTVIILSVRHGARRPLTAEEIRRLN